MSTWTVGTLIVAGSVAASLAGLFVVRRIFTPDDLRVHHDVAGAIYAFVGTVYAVLLAFAVVVVWQSWTDAEATVSREANALSDLERMSRAFPVEIRRQVQEGARTYGRLVVRKEWDAMADGGSSEQADAALIELWHIYTDMPERQRGTPLFDQSVVRLNELSDGRRLRLLASHDRVPMVMWILLVFGGVAMVVFAYLFGVRAAWPQTVMISMLSGMVAFTLFLILALNGPFAGDVRVDTDSFEFVLENMESLER